MKREIGEILTKKGGIYLYRQNDPQDGGYVEFTEQTTGIKVVSFLENYIEEMVNRMQFKNVRQKNWYRKEWNTRLKEPESESQYFLLFDGNLIVGYVVLNNKEEMQFFSFYSSKEYGFELKIMKCMVALRTILEQTGAADSGKIILINASGS